MALTLTAGGALLPSGTIISLLPVALLSQRTRTWPEFRLVAFHPYWQSLLIGQQ